MRPIAGLEYVSSRQRKSDHAVKCTNRFGVGIILCQLKKIQNHNLAVNFNIIVVSNICDFVIL